MAMLISDPVNYGDFAVGATIYVYFNTFDGGDGSSATVTDLNADGTDVHIHKDGGLTQRNNAAGVAVDVAYDAKDGINLITIDTSDNTVAGFFTCGSDYMVRIEGVTIDEQTVDACVGIFSIQNRYGRPGGRY